MIISEKGECMDNFLPQDVSKYYEFAHSNELLNNDFMVNFYEKYDVGIFLSCQWKGDKM